MGLKIGEWTKSSRSNGSGGNNCVEVVANPFGVYVRHSTFPEGLPLDFTRREWECFIEGVKAGEFDLPPVTDGIG